MLRFNKFRLAYRPPYPTNPENPVVFIDFTVGKSAPKRVTFELFQDKVPKTALNFFHLCAGDKGMIPGTNKPLCFKNSIAHRIIPGFMVQFGDITNGNGTGGHSIYGRSFADERRWMKHIGPGMLSMANSGPNTNGSQVFCCLAATPWLDGKHEVFGQCLTGYETVAGEIQAVGTQSGMTTQRVAIADCGVVEKKE